MRKLVIFLCLPLQYVVAHALIAVTHKEHKVHNIVLYPDKHSWCKTTPIKQVITHPGCKSVEIDNNVCVGACFSYSIPRTEPETPGDVLPYCDSCQPSQIKWKHVTLECPDSDYEEDNVMNKSVEMIDGCACASCTDPHSKSPSDTESSRQTQHLDVPELMSLMLETHNSRGKSKDQEITSRPDSDKNVTSERVTIALKGIEETEVSLDPEAFRSMRNKLERDDQKIEELGRSTFQEHTKPEQNVTENLQKLKSDLTGLERVPNHSRHQRVPGPHHSMVYPVYSLDIASDLYEKLKSKPTVEVPTGSNDVTSYHLRPMHGSEDDTNDNLIFTTAEQKLTLKKKTEGNMEGQR